MKKTGKSFLLFSLIIFNSALAFSKSYKEYVSPDYYSTLEDEGYIRIIHKDSEKNLTLLPNCDYKDECLKNRVEEKEKLYTFVSESIYLINKADVLNKSNSEKTNITSKDISKVVRSISNMEGMSYYSYTRKVNSILYKKSYMIDNLEDKNRILDQNEGNANGQISYCLQHDHTFGECRYQLNYYESNDTVYCVFKNIDSMGLGFLRAINPDDMRINIIAEDCEDYILLYLEVEANCPNSFAVKKQMETSLISRVEAIYKWFVVQF